MVAGIAALAAGPRGLRAAECAAAFMLGATVLSYIAGAALPQKVRWVPALHGSRWRSRAIACAVGMLHLMCSNPAGRGADKGFLALSCRCTITCTR